MKPIATEIADNYPSIYVDAYRHISISQKKSLNECEKNEYCISEKIEFIEAEILNKFLTILETVNSQTQRCVKVQPDENCVKTQQAEYWEIEDDVRRQQQTIYSQDEFDSTCEKNGVLMKYDTASRRKINIAIRSARTKFDDLPGFFTKHNSSLQNGVPINKKTSAILAEYADLISQECLESNDIVFGEIFEASSDHKNVFPEKIRMECHRQWKNYVKRAIAKEMAKLAM